MAPVRSAIVGTGTIAAAHMAAAEQLRDRLEFVTAVDVDQSRLDEFCTSHGIARGYPDTAAMLAAESPDLV